MKTHKEGLASWTSISIIMQNQIHFWRIYVVRGWKQGWTVSQSRMNLSQEIGFLFFASAPYISRSDNLIRLPSAILSLLSPDIAETVIKLNSYCLYPRILSFIRPKGTEYDILVWIVHFRRGVHILTYTLHLLLSYITLLSTELTLEFSLCVFLSSFCKPIFTNVFK